MADFEQLWQDILERCERFQFPLVQDKEELRHVFNLMKKLNSYLEVGTAEGNSLYVLSRALEGESKLNNDSAYIEIIDFGEPHTKIARDQVLNGLGFTICEHLENSHSAKIKVTQDQYDAVLIDAGHSYEDVIADAIAYGHLAIKYIFFHDIQLPPVKAAFEWYCKQNPQFKNISTFINSPNYGYGIIEV